MGSEDDDSQFGMIGKSKPMRELYALIVKIARAQITVLVTGETGTGKERVARALHDASRREGKFVAVNCASIPPTLIESELFGTTKGAYNDSIDKPGRFELAHDGTLFLDEIGELPVNMQPKLLRVIQEQTFERVGGIKTIEVDVRVVAATNRDLEEEIRAGRFREDLYYRLKGASLKLPTLRERREDIPLLVKHFIDRYRGDRNIRGVADAAMEDLFSRAWPGNIRELEKAIQYALVMTSGDCTELTTEHFPPSAPDTTSVLARVVDVLGVHEHLLCRFFAPAKPGTRPSNRRRSRGSMAQVEKLRQLALALAVVCRLVEQDEQRLAVRFLGNVAGYDNRRLEHLVHAAKTGVPPATMTSAKYWRGMASPWSTELSFEMFEPLSDLWSAETVPDRVTVTAFFERFSALSWMRPAAAALASSPPRTSATAEAKVIIVPPGPLRRREFTSVGQEARRDGYSIAKLPEWADGQHADVLLVEGPAALLKGDDKEILGEAKTQVKRVVFFQSVAEHGTRYRDATSFVQTAITEVSRSLAPGHFDADDVEAMEALGELPECCVLALQRLRSQPAVEPALMGCIRPLMDAGFVMRDPERRDAVLTDVGKLVASCIREHLR